MFGKGVSESLNVDEPRFATQEGENDTVYGR